MILVRGERRHAEDLREQSSGPTGPDGTAPVAGQDTDHPHRRGTSTSSVGASSVTAVRETPDSFVYTYPSKKALTSITGKVKAICQAGQNLDLAVVLHQLNPVLRGWTTYFRPGVSFKTFGYLRAFTWRQVMHRLRRKHRRSTWKELRRRYCGGGWWPTDGDVILFNPTDAGTTRYRYRGAQIPSPWPTAA